jgi:PAS domain S-box-containing protein
VTDAEADELRQRVAALEAENARLREALEEQNRGPDIDPHALPAATLAASRARLREALTIATVGGIYFDLDGQLLDANDAFLAMCGYSREDLNAGRLSWQVLTPPEWLDVSWRAFKDLKATGRTTPYEKQYFRKDGSRFWAMFGATLLEDGRGFEFVIDITDRKRVEADLAAREAELRLIADAMPALIAFIDRTFTYRFANAAYEAWIGRRPEHVVGRTIEELLGTAEFEARRPLIEQAMAGADVQFERSWPHPDGRPRDAAIRYIPNRSQTGEVVGIYVFVQDITDRKQTEELLALRAQQLEAQVAEQEKARDRIWNLSPVLKFVARHDGEIRSVNPSWTRSLGWSEEETIGRNVLDFVAPDGREQAASDLMRRAATPASGDIELMLLTKENGPRHVSWTVVPGDDLLFGFGRDITEQRFAEEALRQSQKLEAVGQLTGGVAHDFNNLLTIIRSSVDFLRRPELPEVRKVRYLDAVSETVDRAAKLTGQLLAFARRQTLKPEVFDVGARLHAVADMLDTVTGARIRVVTEGLDTACYVRADLSQFETALINMAVNARDAMEGEGTLTLRLTCSVSMPPIRGHAGAPGPFAAISLSDTGSGITAERIGRIFEPFFTTKEVGRGTGLGLSQVFGFAKQSGGDVSVESVVGDGTTFTLFLPETEAVQEAEVPGRQGDEPPIGAGQRILVVEDNVEVGRFATQILQDLGFETRWAANAEEALSALVSEPAAFEAVFSDVVMPGMGGIELAKRLRRTHPDLPVILTSGYSHVLAQEGAHGFELVQKPYSADQVSKALCKAIAPRPRSERTGSAEAFDKPIRPARG